MRSISSPRHLSRLWSLALVLVVAGMVSLAFAQQNAAKARTRMEYLSQEVQADAMVPTMNDLDAQGWDLFQVVPIWKIQGDGGESSLIPKSFQVFGRRAMAGR